MKLKTLAFSILLCGLSIANNSGSTAHASVALLDVSPAEARTGVLKLSDLRSAYLLRANAVDYDSAQMSPAGVRGQLQRHFNVVLGVLIATTPRSVEVALDRLEAASGRTWATTERALMRRQLVRNRLVQLRRLAAYRDRGVFPLNEGQSAGAVPIFVDAHDTACAVGHLMRLSGWQDSVAAIQHANNLVYVPDAADSAVARWALTSGLTLEEAALVQPGYAGFNAPYLIGDYEPGELSLVSEGLKYENIQLHIQNFQLQNATFHQAIDNCPDPNSCANLIPGAVVTPLEPVGFNAGGDMLVASADTFNPVGTNWISFGGALFLLDPFTPDELRRLRGETSTDGLQRLMLQFDVSTVDANKFITQSSQFSYPTYDNIGPLFITSEEYEMTTVASDGGPVGSVHFEELPDLGFLPKESTTALPASNQLTVKSTIWLYNGATVNGYVIGFEVIPEPTSLMLSVAGALGIVAVRRRRQRLQ